MPTAPSPRQQRRPRPAAPTPSTPPARRAAEPDPLAPLRLALAQGDTCLRQAAEARGCTTAELKARLYPSGGRHAGP